MPHITVEYSSNLPDRPDHKKMLRALHDALCTLESYKMADIKSRVIVHDDFVVSDGENNQGFVHIQLAIMPRPPEIKKATTAKLLDVIKDIFAQSLRSKHVSLSVETRDLDKESYAKMTSGVL